MNSKFKSSLLDLEQRYYRLIENLECTVEQQAQELAAWITESEEVLNDFIVFYNQFLFFSKHQTSIVEKVWTLLTIETISLTLYQGNDNYWFLFSGNAMLSILDEHLTTLPKVCYQQQFKSFDFNAKRLIIDEEFVRSNRKVVSLLLYSYDDEASVPIETILKEVFVINNLAITVTNLSNLLLIKQYTQLQELGLSFDINLAIDFSFLASMKRLKVLKLLGEFAAIPSILYEMDSLEAIYIIEYTGTTLDMNFLKKKQLKYLSLTAFNITEQTIESIISQAPSNVTVEIC